MLLVYPIKNKQTPLSLWSVLYPRSEMHWAWDEDADDRVASLWHLRESLAESREVVYSKWFGGRATFFSCDLFRAMLAAFRAETDLRIGLEADSLKLLAALQENSPQPTRMLREATDLQGRYLESAYTRAIRPLWNRLLIVGTGEIAEGGFPSLAMAATDVYFEELWAQSAHRTERDLERLTRAINESTAFARAWKRLQTSLPHYMNLRGGRGIERA